MRPFTSKFPVRVLCWNRGVFTAFWFVVPVIFGSSSGNALPIDNFNVPSETRCKGERTCKRNLSNDASLGGFLGLEVQNPAEGKGITLLEIKTGPTKGRVVWGAAGEPAGRLTLFWDGDPNPSQVSGAGLGCLNLLADGATAFILEDLAYSATCSKSPNSEKSGAGGSDSAGALCPPLVIDTKMYDATDPTGQRYSTSIIRRHHRMSGKDLRIPFSSFTQEGPNGGAHPTCVGAVSMTIRADELTKSVVTFGPMYTNGACQTGSCLLPPPFMPEGTPIGTPTASPTNVGEKGAPTVTGAPAGTTTPTAPGNIPALSSTAPSGVPNRVPSVVASTVTTTNLTPAAKQTAPPKVSPLPTPIESKLKRESKNGAFENETVPTALEVAPKEAPTQILPPVTEEFIFGEVVQHKAASPARAAPETSIISPPNFNTNAHSEVD